VRRLAPAAGVLLASLVAGCGTAASPPTQGAADAVPVVARDSEGSQAFAVSAAVATHTKQAAAPTAVVVHRQPQQAANADSGVSPGAPSNAEVLRELKQLKDINATQRRQQEAATSGLVRGTTPGGNAPIAAGLPDAVARVLAGANAIARYPYVYGGGHRSFVDSAYDCSGSVSYALAAGGFLNHPLDSGQLAHAGAPGPGRYITIYANPGHVFMYVAGLRFDTSGRDGPKGSRWQRAPRSLAGFHARHPPGY